VGVKLKLMGGESFGSGLEEARMMTEEEEDPEKTQEQKSLRDTWEGTSIQCQEKGRRMRGIARTKGQRGEQTW
jgi:hypothetical protein